MSRMTRVLVVTVMLIAGASTGWFWYANSTEDQTSEIFVSSEIKEILSQAGQQTDIDPDMPEPPSRTEADPAIQNQSEPTPEAAKGNDMEHLVPAKILLPVPFIVQAPFANWDLPYKEACEEASVMMVDHFYRETEELSEEQMKEAIDAIINWGAEEFDAIDTTAEQTARYFTDKLGYGASRVKVVYDFTVDDMKALLAQGIPLIVPAAGRELGNRYFQQPGPLYHMLVVIGYEGNEFITHDPGTKRGALYRYDANVLYSAIHDLTEDRERITEGKKALLIVLPETL